MRLKKLKETSKFKYNTLYYLFKSGKFITTFTYDKTDENDNYPFMIGGGSHSYGQFVDLSTNDYTFIEASTKNEIIQKDVALSLLSYGVMNNALDYKIDFVSCNFCGNNEKLNWKNSANLVHKDDCLVNIAKKYNL